MNLLFPVIPLKRLPATLGIAVIGAAVAGTYGALHDQISYRISPEYFTKMKFEQFRYADFGFAEPVFAAEVGFLATWWVGLLCGWFLARAGLNRVTGDERRRLVIQTFSMVFVAAFISGIVGGSLGWWVANRGDFARWQDFQRTLGINDMHGFVIVAHLHAAGYLGALAGFVVALVFVRRSVSRLSLTSVFVAQ